MKGCEQMFYNMDFTDAKNSCGAIVFKARIFKRLNGNCVRSEPSSVFSVQGPDQIPLPNDSSVQAKIKEQSDKKGDEEEGDSPSIRELAKQINCHVEVINVDNLTSNVPPEGSKDPKINLVPTPQLLERLPLSPL